MTTKNISENNRNYSTEPYGLEEGSDKERLADPAEEQTDTENIIVDLANEPTEKV